MEMFLMTNPSMDWQVAHLRSLYYSEELIEAHSVITV